MTTSQTHLHLSSFHKETNSTPLLRTTTGVQNPSEPAADVSFCDDYIKWIRIKVSVGEVDASKPPQIYK
jgi:hypothetical protein